MNHGQQTPGLQLQLDNNNPSLNNPDTRYRHRFFYQVGYEIMYASKGCFKSEETGGFYLSKINIPNHYPEQKI